VELTFGQNAVTHSFVEIPHWLCPLVMQRLVGRKIVVCNATDSALAPLHCVDAQQPIKTAVSTNRNVRSNSMFNSLGRILDHRYRNSRKSRFFTLAVAEQSGPRKSGGNVLDD
jgi:hypothetical protein